MNITSCEMTHNILKMNLLNPYYELDFKKIFVESFIDRID